MKRHILNFTHSGAQFRIYVNWQGAGDGETELNGALEIIENEVGPSAESPTEFRNGVELALKNAGFQLFKA